MDHSEVLKSYILSKAKNSSSAYQAQKEHTPPQESRLTKTGNRLRRMAVSIRRRPRRYIKYAVLLFILIMILTAVATYLYFARDIYDKERLMNRNNVGVTLLDRNGKVFFAFYQPKNKTTVPISQIPVSTRQAVVSIEDKGFYSNPGFSVSAIGRAFFTDLASQDFTVGGSTITQQLVKNLLLTTQKSLLRKYQEIVLAIEIDRVYSKEDILEMYLNSVYFGEGAFGIEDASQVYFKKSARDLSLAQSALLAGLLQSPSATSPLSNDPALAKQRQRLVLAQMKAQGYITATEENQAVNQSLVYAPKKPEDINLLAPHFALTVKDQLAQRFGGEDALINSGLIVKTTLNLDYQKYAETAVLNQVNNLRRNKVSNGAAVALDPKTGQVLVLVGSKDWADETVGKYDIATALRQPGSAMKPIVYGAALEKKIITTATILQDQATDFGGGYKPKDYDGKYRGDVTVRRALSNSLNIPAVEVLQQLGVDDAVSKARQMGLTTLGDPSQYGLSLVLGAGEVRLLDLTNAYASFASYGRLHQPTFIIEVKDRNGKTIYQAKDDSKGVIEPEAAFLISSILSDNNARAETFGGALTISHPAAVKTGTTDSYRDGWTIGYTPSLVVGAWVGNNDNTPMDAVGGSLGAAPIWRNMMNKFLSGTPIEQFRPVGSVVEVETCQPGPSPSPGASPVPQVRAKEYFISGTQPDACPTPEPSPTPPDTPEPTQQSPSPEETSAPSLENTLPVVP